MGLSWMKNYFKNLKIWEFACGEATGNKFWHGENIIYQNVKNIIEREKNV
jgi:hypothetical protein